jgi:hypothetical protein
VVLILLGRDDSSIPRDVEPFLLRFWTQNASGCPRVLMSDSEWNKLRHHVVAVVDTRSYTRFNCETAGTFTGNVFETHHCSISEKTGNHNCDVMLVMFLLFFCQ